MSNSQSLVKVIATGTINHGVDGEAIVTYVEGDELTLSMSQADQLIKSGAVLASNDVKTAIAESNVGSTANEQTAVPDLATQLPTQPTAEEVAAAVAYANGSEDTRV